MKKILIIVPAFNEAENIADVILNLQSVNNEWDILVVNDASHDKTSLVAKSTGKAKVVDLPHNLGIGGAVQTGFKYARNNGYDCAIQFDGDGQHNADEIRKLLNLLHLGEADVAIGSRFSQNEANFKSSFFRRMGIKTFEIFSYLIIQQRITDHTSGFRAYNKRALHYVADHYPSDYPEPEVVISLGRNGFKIKEVFTQMHERQGGVSSIPLTRGPYYMIKVLLSMFMASIRAKVYKDE